MYIRRVLAIAWVVAVAACQGPAFAWSINTHMYSANLIIKDLQDDKRLDIQQVVRPGDGTVSLEPLGTLGIPEDVADAILAHPETFRAGSCGPDGYPDVYVGQSIIHPYVPGQAWRATDWARRVLEEASDYDGDNDEDHGKALAFAAGWMVHYAGDAFGHTWVNSYAGGEWDWGDMGIVKRHVILEGYVNSKIPHVGDGTDDMSLDCLSGFAADALLLNKDVYDPLAPAGHMRAIIDYHRAFRHMEKKCEDRQDQWWNPVGWAIGAVEDWLEHYRKESERALSEWCETSTVILRCMADKHPQDIPGEITEWAIEYPFRLCPAIPKQIIDVIGWLGHEISWLFSPITKLQEEVLGYVYNALLASTVEDLINAENLMGEVYSPAIIEQVGVQLGLTEDQAALQVDSFEALRDTVALGKLALLDRNGLRDLGGLLGVGSLARSGNDNILWDCINSLDASDQLTRYPPFRLLETDELKQNAFRRLFLTDPQEAPPSRIDPAHLVAYLTRTDKEVAFMVPLADPGNDRCRLVAYLYQKSDGGGPDQRIPFNEQHIATSGTPGIYNQVLVAKHRVPRYGTYRFHLATAEQAEGSEDLIEDQGVDIEVKMVKQEQLPEAVVPTFPGMEEVLAAQQALADMFVRAAEEALQNPNLPADMRAQMQQQLELAREAAAKLRDQKLPDAGAIPTGPPPGDLDAGTFPPDMLDHLRKMEQDVAVGSTGDDPEELAEAKLRILQMGKFAIGVLQGPLGPVAGGTVTLLEAALYDQLRTGTGVALVKWADYVPLDPMENSGARYHFSRTNERGEFGLTGLADGEYQLIATGPGLGKTSRRVVIQRGQDLVLELDPVVATVEPDATGAGNQRERTWQPDLALQIEPQFINADCLEKDGTFRASVSLRPLGDITGEAELSVPDLPPGVEVVFSQNPVPLDKPRTVDLTLRAGHKPPGPTTLVVRAQVGELVREAPVSASLATGELVVEPEGLELVRDGQTSLRLTWKAPPEGGQAARVAVGKLPAGVRVRASQIRAHPYAQPLVFDELTVEKTDELREGLREIVAVPQVPRPERLIVTPTLIRKAPTEAPVRGILLAPGGWTDITVSVAASVRPGTYRVPVACALGKHLVNSDVRVQVRR